MSWEDVSPYSAHIFDHVIEWLTGVDSDVPHSGYPWYDVPLLEHLLLDSRHIADHFGRFQNRVLEEGTHITPSRARGADQ